jgi:hypothetical protein
MSQLLFHRQFMSDLEVLRDEVTETTETPVYHETNSLEIRDRQAICFFLEN